MNLSYKLHMLHRCWRYRLLREKQSLWFVLNQKLSTSMAIDIGASRGIYSYWLSKKVGAKGQILAFEPQPELAPQLELLKESFKLSNLQIVNKGLSNKHGFLDLYRAKTGDRSATFEDEYKKNKEDRVNVEVLRLDDYFEKNPIGSLPLSFIKADVEGHELKVFLGARETLLKHKPILLFECHDHEAKKGDLFSLVMEYGYQGFFPHEKTLVKCEDYDKYPYGKKGETNRNYIFLPD